MDNIALVGHSRGGEAVVAAAVFNRLNAYPDDAVDGPAFDYDFAIRGIVAIAPVDGTYRPAGQAMALEGVNYLVLHGSHDMDVFVFKGQGQYARTRVDRDPNAPAAELFKSSLYVYGANHGQFNTVWGRKDSIEPVMRLFNLAQLMEPEAQRQVARVAVGAFLEAVLYGRTDYRALFRDPRRAEAWFPETVIISQYQDGSTQLVSTYEEDVDVRTATMPGGVQGAEHMTLWREGPVAGKWETTGNQAVILGWHTAASIDATPTYFVRFPDEDIVVRETSSLVFDLADANLDPTLDDGNRWAPPSSRPLIDLTVAVVDSDGDAACLPLSHVALLLPQLEGQLGKAGFMSLLPTSEAVFQRFAFPMEDFVNANPDFDSARLEEIRLLFDRTQAGSVYLDNVGFWKP
jgi:hypothetical protein